MSIASFHKSYFTVNTRIGEEVLYVSPFGTTSEQVFNFSSSLEKIGYEWDCSLKNNTKVTIISDPVEINRPQYGGIISLTRIQTRMGVEMWIPTAHLVRNCK